MLRELADSAIKILVAAFAIMSICALFDEVIERVWPISLLDSLLVVVSVFVALVVLLLVIRAIQNLFPPGQNQFVQSDDAACE